MPSLRKKIPVAGKKKKELFEKVSKEVDRFLEKDSSIHLEFEQIPDEYHVLVTSKYVSGVIQCEDEQVSVELKLSLIALPFQGKIEQGIDRWIQRSFFPGEAASKDSKSSKPRKA